MNSPVIEDVDRAFLEDALWIWRRGVEGIVEVVDADPSIEGLKRWVEADVLPTHKLRIARASNQVVGVLASSAESVCALYVRPDHQGMGIGSALLDVAKSDSAGSLWLFTFAKNSRARTFYAKNGFVELAFGFESHWKLDDVKLEWSRSARLARTFGSTTLQTAIDA